MFKAIMEADKIKRWIRIVNTIEDLVDEACFYISPDSLMFREVDNTRVSMINMSMNKDYFDLFEFNAENPFFVCVHSDKLTKYSKALSKSDELIIEVGEGRLILASKRPYEKKFVLPAIIDDERELSRVPEIEYAVNVRMVVPTLRDILKEAKEVSETVTIHALDSEINFISKSEEGFQASHKLKYPDNVEILDINVSEESTSVYAVKPLLNVVKELASISGIVTLQFSTEYPLSLKFEMVENESYQFIMAPRSEE